MEQAYCNNEHPCICWFFQLISRSGDVLLIEKKQFFGGWVVFTSDFLHHKFSLFLGALKWCCSFFSCFRSIFWRWKHTAASSIFWVVFRKLSGPSLAKHLPFLLCISVIPPISMVCGIILRVPFLSTEIQPMNINLDKPLRIAKLYTTYEDERCRWEWWNNHPSDLREHKLYRLYLISWNRWLNRDFHFMDTKPMQCLWQRIEFHPPQTSQMMQKEKHSSKKQRFQKWLRNYCNKILCYFVVSTNFQNMVHFPKK